MILRALRAYSFGVLNPGFELADLQDGITVVHGPNEAGKSTLLRALTYALYQRHKVGGEDSEREILPVGTSLAPRIEVEFEKGGERWKIEKTFLKRKAAVLSRFDGNQFVPKFDADSADEELKRILDSEYAGRGIGKVEHRGIGEVLICDQDSLRSVRELGHLARASLRGVLGSVSTTSEARGLAAMVLQRREQLFTSKGELRATSTLAGAKAELTALDASLATIAREREDILTLERQLEEVGSGEAELAERKRRLTDALRAAEDDDRKRCTLAEREQGKSRELNAAKEKLKAAERLENELRTATDHLDVLASSIEHAQSEVDAVSLVVAAERAQLAAAEKDEADLRTGRGDLESALLVAEDVLKAAQARARMDELGQRLDDYRAALKVEADLQGKLASRARPTQEEFDEISGICVQLEKAREALAALGLHLRIEAHEPLALRGPSGAKQVAKGETIELQSMSPLRVDIKGVAKLEARAPEGRDVTRLHATISDLEHDLREATDPFGTSELADLKKQLAERTRLDAQIAAHTSRRQGVFSSETLFTKSDKEHAESRAEFATIVKRRPELADDLPTVVQAQKHARDARRLKEERDGRIETAQAEIGKARKRLETAVTKHQQQVADLARLEAQREGLKATRDALGGNTASAERDAELERLRLEVALHTRQLSSVALELAPLREAEGALENLKRELSELAELADSRMQARSQNEGKLSLLRDRGLYAEQARIEERHVQLEQQIAREQLDADAVRLLAQVVDEEERRSVDAVIAPVAERVRRMAIAVLRREVRISFDENLSTTGVQLGDDSFSLGQLSAGTQDQLAVLTRIAFAETYADRFGRHTLVLDDPLANSDATRRRRMVDVLARAAEKLQVLIFTCREEDYLGLNARRVLINAAS
jgi:DNA repair exonuclease SbcCD ATPase subunit